jgi:hypothetical protein
MSDGILVHECTVRAPRYVFNPVTLSWIGLTIFTALVWVALIKAALLIIN